MPVRPLGILSNTKRIRSFDWTTNPLSVRSGFRSINGLLVQTALERGHNTASQSGFFATRVRPVRKEKAR